VPSRRAPVWTNTWGILSDAFEEGGFQGHTVASDALAGSSRHGGISELRRTFAWRRPDSIVLALKSVKLLKGET